VHLSLAFVIGYRYFIVSLIQSLPCSPSTSPAVLNTARGRHRPRNHMPNNRHKSSLQRCRLLYSKGVLNKINKIK
ncbi:Uncharacterized protein APZ42_002972, partial [Daphnia magna]